MAEGNGNREFGEIQATLRSIERAMDRVDGRLDGMAAQLAAHGEAASKRDSRLDEHERQLGRLWEWKDGMGLRLATYIGVAVTLGGVVVWLVTGRAPA